MARHTCFQTMLAAVVILSFAAVLQADTKLVIAHSSHGAGIALGTRIGSPIVAGGCYPPVHRHVVIGSPWRHRFVRMGPPVVVHPPVVRHVVVEPAPPVLVRAPLPVQGTITVWVTNSNGSRTSVQLTRQGPWYVGPRGEYYAEMPTNEQLRVVYGF